MKTTDTAWINGKGFVNIPAKFFARNELVALMDQGYYPCAIQGGVFTIAIFDKEDRCVGWANKD